MSPPRYFRMPPSFEAPGIQDPPPAYREHDLEAQQPIPPPQPAHVAARPQQITHLEIGRFSSTQLGRVVSRQVHQPPPPTKKSARKKCDIGHVGRIIWSCCLVVIVFVPMIWVAVMKS